MKTPADRFLALDAARLTADAYGNHAIDEFFAGRITRRELLRHASVIGLALAGGGVLNAPRARAQGTAGVSNQTIRVAHLTPAGAVDPLTVTDAASLALLNQTGEFLIDDDGEKLMLKPALALSWKPNDKGDVWTFKLRQNVKFHDGQAFSAKDVVATFDRLADPASGSAALSVLKGVLSKGGAKVVDEHTVAFHLDAPNGNFPYYVSSDNYNAVILPANYAGGYEKTFIGTGPFRFEKYQPKVGASFVRNPDYWGDKALPQRVQFSFYADEQAQLLALQGHQADVMGTFTVQGGAGILNNPDYKAVGVKSSAHRQIHMRNDNPLFKDKRVREALALSLDRDVLVRGLFKGRAQLGNDSPFAPVFPSSDAGVAATQGRHREGKATACASRRAERLRRDADHRKIHGDSRSRGGRAERGEGDRRAHQSEGREPVAVLRRGHARQIRLARLAARHHRLRPSRRAERVPERAAHQHRHLERRAFQESAIRSTGRAVRRGDRPRVAEEKSPRRSRPCCSTKLPSSFRSSTIS